MHTSNENKCQPGWSSSNHNEEHSKLVNDVLVEISKLPFVRAWKFHSGVFRQLRSDSKVRIGLPGAADITGILLVTFAGREIGIRIEIEIKTGTGRQEPDQKKFQAMIERMGGFYVVARSVSEAVEFCNRVAKLFMTAEGSDASSATRNLKTHRPNIKGNYE